MTSAAELARWLGLEEESPGRWRGPCPLCGGSRRFTLHEGRGGAPLWSCWHGCSGRLIARELARRGLLGDQPQAPKPRAVPKPKAPAETPRRVIEAEYVYQDETGRPAFMVRRYRPKSFAQFKPDGRGGWVPGRGNAPGVPFRLPEILKECIWLVTEGEKDCLCLVEHGFSGATTAAGGAGKWLKQFEEFHWRRYFENRIVVVLPDNDGPGAAHAVQVLDSLRGVARARILLPVPDGAKDITEAIEKGLASDAWIADRIDSALLAIEKSGRDFHYVAA